MREIWILFYVAVATLGAMEPIVDAQWLEKHLDDKGLIVLDVSDTQSYKNGHIPTSIHSPLSKWREAKGSFSLVRDEQEIAKEFERLGIDKDSRVIVYSHYHNPKEILKVSYILWAMEYYGFERTSMLDGGISGWNTHSKRLEYKDSFAKKKGTFQVQKNDTLVADLKQVSNAIGRSKMLDARPSVYYFGVKKQDVLKKAGHIPKAKSYFWQYSFIGSSIKKRALLKKIFLEGMQLNPHEALITYCTGGLETSMNFFVLHRILGFDNIRLYDASMKEWANKADTPMQLYRWE